MSVTVHWRPVGEKHAQFENGTSTELEVLKQTFGNIIKGADAPTLRAMGRAAPNNEFYEEVAHIAETFGPIEFWGEY